MPSQPGEQIMLLATTESGPGSEAFVEDAHLLGFQPPHRHIRPEEPETQRRPLVRLLGDEHCVLRMNPWAQSEGSTLLRRRLDGAADEPDVRCETLIQRCQPVVSGFAVVIHECDDLTGSCGKPRVAGRTGPHAVQMNVPDTGVTVGSPECLLV